MSRRSHWAAAVALSVLTLTAVGCGSDVTTSTESTTSSPAATGTSAPVAADVTVGDPWARTSPMSSELGAVYLTLTSNTGDTLLGAAVPTSVAGSTEIHETAMADGTGTTMMPGTTAGDDTSDTTEMTQMTEPPGTMGGDSPMPGSGEMEMRPISSLDLPAGEAVALEPGGYHIMLIDLVAPLVAGDTLEVTLTFERAGEQVVTVTVRDS